MRELREGHEALSTRVSGVEECVTLHHVREYMRRIILIEERIEASGGAIGETLRECQVRLDQCTACLTDLDNRERAQEQHHEVSEHESSDENRQTTDGRPSHSRAAPKRRLIAQARVPLRELEPWIAQLQRDTQAQGSDEQTIHQRITRFLAEHQRQEANGRGTLEQRLDQLRHEFQGDMTDHEISFQHIADTFRDRGNRHKQLRGVVYNHIMNEFEAIQVKFSRADEWMSEVLGDLSSVP